jgi:hypothetical protein
MPVKKSSTGDYQSLASSSRKNGAADNGISSLKPSSRINSTTPPASEPVSDLGLINTRRSLPAETVSGGEIDPSPNRQMTPVETVVTKVDVPTVPVSVEPLSYAEEQKRRKIERGREKDQKLLNSDRWLNRNGHTLTYIGIFLFTFSVYFRPYEWIPGFGSFTSMAMICAVGTLLVYLPSQLATEGNFTIFTTEVKCIFFIAVWAVLTMPISKDPGMAWETFYDLYSKVVIMFVVIVNTLRTRSRLTGLLWLSLGIGAVVSFMTVEAYSRGEFAIEGYRAKADFKGMFDNPNDMCVHLVMFIPIAVALGLSTRNLVAKILYFGVTALMLMAVFATQSRAGFIGLLAVFAVMVWKLSKRNRVQIIAVAIFIAVGVTLAAPGDYGKRVLSIFNSTLDVTGSSDQRSEILKRSIIVTIRNPTGIGMGNFPIVSVHNLQTHNAFTQISAELGWLALAAYLIFMISPFRKLGVVERQLFEKEDSSWIYYLSIGLQASIIGYMFSSFFASVAYQWYIYYPVAYAICLRRIYQLEQNKQNAEGSQNDPATALRPVVT